MLRKGTALLLLAGLAAVFWQLFAGFTPRPSLGPTAAWYLAHAAEVGSANVVSAVVVIWRGLDTLGEVTVLFLVSALVSVFLSREKTSGARPTAPSHLLEVAARLLLAPVILLGVYIFVHGHLSPGGGFQGGAVLASATLLGLLAFPEHGLSHRVLDAVESVSGVVYVLLALAGLVWAGGFLDARLLPVGRLGDLLSGGILPLLYVFIGLKVGAGLSGVLGQLHAARGEGE